MPRGAKVLAVYTLLALLLAVSLPVLVLLGPSVSPIISADAAADPVSGLTPLPEFVRDHVISIEYSSQGGRGNSGVFWTELWYRIAGSAEWTLYTTPWNPSGQWVGERADDPPGSVHGTILFHTFYTGGDAEYEFATVTVDRGYKRESGPDGVKARTTLDTRPPQLFIASPVPGAWISDRILRWTATDALSGLQTVEASLDSGEFQAFAVDVGAKEANGAEPLALDSEGAHSVVVRARDRAGNLAEVPVDFYFDATAPGLTILAPAPDSFLNDRTVEVRWVLADDGPDAGSIRIVLDSDEPVELPGDADRYVFPDVPEGLHILTILAKDAAGHVVSKTLSFGVDVTAPNLVITAPTQDSWTSGSTLRWTFNDAVSGLASLESFLDGGDPQAVDVTVGAKEGSGSADLALDAEGDHSVILRAMDRAGNLAEVSVTFRFDPLAPSLAILAPEPEALTRSRTVEVRWTAGDDESGVASIQLTLNSETPLVLAGDTDRYLLSDLADGRHVVRLVAVDEAGNLALETVSFRVDVTPPDLLLVAPRSGSYTNQQDLQVLWTAADAVSGVDHVDLSLVEAGRHVTVLSGTEYTFESVSEGVHTVRVLAVDVAGNVAEVNGTFTVDFTPPTLSLVGPGSGATVYGTLRIEWNAEDALSGLDRVELLYDEGPSIVLTDLSSIDIADPVVGQHFAVVRAWDRAGNSAEVSVTFFYGGETPSDGGPLGIPGLDFWILMLIIGAGAVGSAYFALRRRRKSRS